MQRGCWSDPVDGGDIGLSQELGAGWKEQEEGAERERAQTSNATSIIWPGTERSYGAQMGASAQS